MKVVSAFFSEPIEPASLNANSFSLTEAGADGKLGTGDDLIITQGIVQLDSEGRRGSLIFAQGLPFGAYRLTLSTAVADLAGNHLAEPFISKFEVREITIVAERGTPAA